MEPVKMSHPGSDKIKTTHHTAVPRFEEQGWVVVGDESADLPESAGTLEPPPPPTVEDAANNDEVMTEEV